MKKFLFLTSAILLFSAAAMAQTQKGIDTQTQKIKEDNNRTNQNNNNVSRSWDFGKDKTKVRERLANPYRMNARRDRLVETILEVLKERKIVADESASRFSEGIVVTQPFVFAKGAVITRNEINRYAVLPNADTVWTRGRYTLTIEVQSIDGVQNNVSVTAKVEGRSETGIQSEWTTLQSSGVAEDEFLARLVELVTGVSPNELTTDNQ